MNLNNLLNNKSDFLNNKSPKDFPWKSTKIERERERLERASIKYKQNNSGLIEINRSDLLNKQIQIEDNKIHKFKNKEPKIRKNNFNGEKCFFGSVFQDFWFIDTKPKIRVNLDGSNQYQNTTLFTITKNNLSKNNSYLECIDQWHKVKKFPNIGIIFNPKKIDLIYANKNNNGLKGRKIEELNDETFRNLYRNDFGVLQDKIKKKNYIENVKNLHPEEKIKQTIAFLQRKQVRNHKLLPHNDLTIKPRNSNEYDISSLFFILPEEKDLLEKQINFIEENFDKINKFQRDRNLDNIICIDRINGKVVEIKLDRLKQKLNAIKQIYFREYKQKKIDNKNVNKRTNNFIKR